MEKWKMFFQKHKKIILIILIVILVLFLLILSLLVKKQGGKSNVSRGVKLSTVIKEEEITTPSFMVEKNYSYTHCTENGYICIDNIQVYQDKNQRGEMVFSLTYDMEKDPNKEEASLRGDVSGYLVVSLGKMAEEEFQVYEDILIYYKIYVDQKKGEVHYGYDGYDFLSNSAFDDFQVRVASEEDKASLLNLDPTIDDNAYFEALDKIRPKKENDYTKGE